MHDVELALTERKVLLSKIAGVECVSTELTANSKTSATYVYVGMYDANAKHYPRS